MRSCSRSTALSARTCRSRDTGRGCVRWPGLMLAACPWNPGCLWRTRRRRHPRQSVGKTSGHDPACYGLALTVSHAFATLYRAGRPVPPRKQGRIGQLLCEPRTGHARRWHPPLGHVGDVRPPHPCGGQRSRPARAHRMTSSGFVRDPPRQRSATQSHDEVFSIS